MLIRAIKGGLWKATFLCEAVFEVEQVVARLTAEEREHALSMLQVGI